MNLNTGKWKFYYLNKLFDIKAGKYYYSYEYNKGSTPYISASNDNNGIKEYIDIEPDFQGNCIVTGKVGCTAFYQPEPFCATSDVNILVPKFTLNEYIGLFIVAVINYSENYKWNYGRQCRVGDTKKIMIKLPTKDNHPDWEFMENYIKTLHHKKVTSKNKQKVTISTKEWKEFVFGDLIGDKNIYKAKKYNTNELNIAKRNTGENKIPYITRKEFNNSCQFMAEYDDYEYIEKGNAIVIGDTTSTISYQEEDFICGDHIVIIRAEWLNKYTGLFMVTLLRQERYRYSYGRAFLKDTIYQTKLLLPTKDNHPDWEFMENYIKTLPYGDRI